MAIGTNSAQSYYKNLIYATATRFLPKRNRTKIAHCSFGYTIILR